MRGRLVVALVVAAGIAGCGGEDGRPEGVALNEAHFSIVWPAPGDTTVIVLELPPRLHPDGPPDHVVIGDFELVDGEAVLSANDCLRRDGTPNSATVDVDEAAGEWYVVTLTLRSSPDAFCHGLFEPGVTYTASIA